MTLDARPHQGPTEITFVGREAELEQLQSGFDAALCGKRALAMVVGDLGLARPRSASSCRRTRSAVVAEFSSATATKSRSLSRPYQPFVEAMRTYVMARPSEALRTEIGAGAVELARLVPELRQRLGR